MEVIHPRSHSQKVKELRSEPGFMPFGWWEPEHEAGQTGRGLLGLPPPRPLPAWKGLTLPRTELHVPRTSLCSGSSARGGSTNLHAQQAREQPRGPSHAPHPLASPTVSLMLVLHTLVHTRAHPRPLAHWLIASSTHMLLGTSPSLTSVRASLTEHVGGPGALPTPLPWAAWPGPGHGCRLPAPSCPPLLPGATRFVSQQSRSKEGSFSQTHGNSSSRTSVAPRAHGRQWPPGPMD